MKKPLNIVSISTGDEETFDVSVAHTCPICGTALSPEILYGTLVENSDTCGDTVYLLNFCPKCSECFVSKHNLTKYGDFDFASSAPMNFVKSHFSDNLHALSPQFVSTYNESLQAESTGLTLICGMGYRKALEFLVKDYAISCSPNNRENIEKMPLSQCIKEYLHSPRLQTLATASAWLGNDQTHYVKKHSDYSLAEMKQFISAFVAFIDAELSLRQAEELLTSKK